MTVEAVVRLLLFFNGFSSLFFFHFFPSALLVIVPLTSPRALYGRAQSLVPPLYCITCRFTHCARLAYYKSLKWPPVVSSLLACCPAAHLVYCYRMLTRFTTRTTRRALYCACTCASPFFHHSWHVALLHIWYMSVVESLTLGTHDTCPHTAVYVSSYCCICVLMLLCMCPHTAIYVPSYSRVPHSGYTQYVSSYCYMCPHAAMYVSSCCYTCVLILSPSLCVHTHLSLCLTPSRTRSVPDNIFVP